MSVLSAPKSKQSSNQNIAYDRPKPASKIGRFFDDRLRRMVFRRLQHIGGGQITLVDVEGSHTFGLSAEGKTPAVVQVLDSAFYRHLALGGSLGAAESYILGYWQCEKLVELMQLFGKNITAVHGMESGPARLTRAVQKMTHRLRNNSLDGSRRNIAAHYDLGDDFFSIFLDKTMAYSCGIFPNPHSTLQEASMAKFERVCRKLQLAEGDHVMEIGSGWGGFAIYAAQNHGCRVTTTTISKKQYDFTLHRVQEAGLQDRITVLCRDYRELDGQFDKLVSIEMIEAVGYEYFDTFFRNCSKLLKPHGAMLLQAITIPDQRFDRYRRSVDFIQRYVFPGGCLPSLGAICASLKRATDMRILDLEDLTAHYAKTLAHWRHRFHVNIDQVSELGFAEEFRRLWEYYFCYCEAGFRECMIGDAQILLCKPESRFSWTISEPI